MNRLWNLARRASKKPVVAATPADVVHTENKWRLLRYRPRPGGVAFQTPVLLVPSLINRHYVLDLMPGKSFAEYLVAQGHDTFVIDWGTPGPEDRFLTFDDVCDRYLGRAVRKAAAASGRGKAHLLGYCLGGTLTSIYAAVRPEHVASMAVLAAPVRFHDEGLLSKWTRSERFDLDAVVEACGNVPWQLMQSGFQLLRPTLPLAKAVSLLDKAWNDEFLDGFFALETWGNDNVSFPGECFRRYVGALYREDALVAGTFTLSGKPARLENLRCPTLAVTFEHDNIVPWRSAAELLERIGAQDKHHLHLPGGHVGAVVSKSAARGLWTKLSAFYAARDAEASDPTTPVKDERRRPAGAPSRKTAPTSESRHSSATSGEVSGAEDAPGAVDHGKQKRRSAGKGSRAAS